MRQAPARDDSRSYRGEGTSRSVERARTMTNIDEDQIPCIGEHRGVGLHAFQDQARVAVVGRTLTPWTA